MEPQVQPRPPPPPPKAAGLTNILNDDQPSGPNGPLPQLRDSGFYSTAETASKHTSAASFSVNGGLSPTNSGYHSATDKTPSPVTTNMVPQPVVSPSVSNMSVASMVSPTAPGATDSRRFERPTSLESGSGTTLGDGALHPAVVARRESVDSRINQGFSDMRLGSSPYASNNQSTTSIQNSLHSQRNPRPGLEALSVHRISNGYQPSADRNPEPTKTGRTAPAITGPATSHIARAAEPTKGQAWAFPEEEIQRVNPPPYYDDSRRSSITESVASSQFTAESRLPPGQRRLDDSIDYVRISNASGDLLPPVHHHSMQHKQLNDLQAEEVNGPNGSQPYSRTPELRVSHKLAERKRRTEMKELFDQLRDLMPQERGSKASKWEILTKAIAEHQRLADHIRMLQSHYNTAVAENEMLRRELQGVRTEGGHMRGEPTQPPPPPPQQAPPTHAAQPPAPYPPEQYAAGGRPELPPFRTISTSIPNGPESMTGVQYEAPRVNGYRPERY